MAEKAVDAVVIGGGSLGTSTAYHLSLFGAKVWLLERGSIASGTSGACDGQVLLSDRLAGPQMALAKLAVKRWRELALELPFDVEFEVKGSTLIAEEEEDVKELERLVGVLRGEDVPCEVLRGEEMFELEPNLAPDVPALAWFPENGMVQPQLACWAMAQAVSNAGGIVKTHAEVKAIERDKDGRIAAVVTAQDRIPTPVVVNAAGAWSPEIGKMVGVQIPVKPRRGHIVVTEPAPPILRHSTMEAAYGRTVAADEAALQVALVIEHTRSGTMLFGSSREFVGFDRRENLEAVKGIVRRAVRFFPALAQVQAPRCYMGYRPWNPDHVPILGECPWVPGFYLATGHEGAGICLGPISGKLVAQQITGQPPDLDLGPYSLAQLQS